jgi:hypothetical protein
MNWVIMDFFSTLGIGLSLTYGGYALLYNAVTGEFEADPTETISVYAEYLPVVPAIFATINEQIH